MVTTLDSMGLNAAKENHDRYQSKVLYGSMALWSNGFTLIANFTILIMHALPGAVPAVLPCLSFCCHASSSFWAFGNNT
jgi:hypothetical protein